MNREAFPGGDSGATGVFGSVSEVIRAASTLLAIGNTDPRLR